MMRRQIELIMTVENKQGRSVKGIKRVSHNPVSSIKPYLTILFLNYKATPATSKTQ